MIGATRLAFSSANALTASCLACWLGLAPPSLVPRALAACSAALVLVLINSHSCCVSDDDVSTSESSSECSFDDYNDDDYLS